MKDNMKDFREASNTFLKDIYVTDELKRKTLEKCTNKRFLKMSPLIASTVSAALLLSTFGIYNYFIHKTPTTNSYANNSLKQDYKNSTNNEFPKSPSKITENQNLDNSKLDSSKSVALKDENNTKNENASVQTKNSDTNTVTKDTNNANKIFNNISQSKVDNTQPNSTSENKDLNSSITDKNTNIASQNTNNTAEAYDSITQNDISGKRNKDMLLSSESTTGASSLSEPLNMTSAEKYFGGDILLPRNIPEGFNLTAISIPDNKLKCIKLNYSSDSAYFELLQTKNLSILEGNKVIYIKNNKAYVSTTKDEKSNIVTTKITWVMDNIEYSLYGSLSENSLINVAKSIN